MNSMYPVCIHNLITLADISDIGFSEPNIAIGLKNSLTVGLQTCSQQMYETYLTVRFDSVVMEMGDLALYILALFGPLPRTVPFVWTSFNPGVDQRSNLGPLVNEGSWFALTV